VSWFVEDWYCIVGDDGILVMSIGGEGTTPAPVHNRRVDRSPAGRTEYPDNGDGEFPTAFTSSDSIYPFGSHNSIYDRTGTHRKPRTPGTISNLQGLFL
jgi:hypothetical protein